MAKTMYQHMQKRNAMATRKKNGGEDPPKKGSAPLPSALGAIKAPSSNLMAKTEYVPIAKAMGQTEFSKDNFYNRNNANKRNMPKVPEGGKNREYYKQVKAAEDKTNQEMKGLRKSYEQKYKASQGTSTPWTKQQLSDSLTTTHNPSFSKRQIRRDVRAIAGGSAVGDAARAIGKKTKEIAKATGKKIKKVCTPVQKGKAGSGVNLCKISRVGDAF